MQALYASHFRLVRNHANSGSVQLPYEGWDLETGSGLPSRAITSGDRSVGWLIGWPTNLQDSALNLPVVNDQALTDFAHSLAGRFVIIVATPDFQRLYLDAGGSLATVYDAARQVVASTPLDASETVNEAIRDQFGMPPRGTYYPFGLTAMAGVERLIPNHYLDLQTMKQVRHWSAPEIYDHDMMPRIEEIGRLMQRNIGAMAEQYPLLMSLTAGRDSRMVLACAKPFARDILFFTREIDATAASDVASARKLAREHKLQHIVLPFEPLKTDVADEWQRRTGFTVSGRWWESYTAISKLPNDRLFMPGLGVEVGRAYYRRPGDRADDPLQVSDLLARMRLPDVDPIRSRCQRWINDAPTQNRFSLLDMAYLEQRVGCWASPLHYGLVPSDLAVTPVIDRRIYELMLSLPVEYRRAQQLAPDVIRFMWPELLRLPFNQPPLKARIIQQARVMGGKVLRPLRGKRQG